MTYYESRYKERRCPGCGSEYHMPVQTLCDDCRVALKVGQDRLDELDAFADSTEKLRVRIGNSFIPTRPHVISWPDWHRKDAFLKAVGDLIQAEKLARAGYTTFVGPRDPTDFYYRRTVSYSKPSAHWIMTCRQADAVKVILDFVHDTCEYYLDEGIRLGSDLLHNLVTSGVDELNRLTIAKGRRQQKIEGK